MAALQSSRWCPSALRLVAVGVGVGCAAFLIAGAIVDSLLPRLPPERQWGQGRGEEAPPPFTHQTGHSVRTRASREALWRVINRLGGPSEGYFFANILWDCRTFLERLFTAGPVAAGRPERELLEARDTVDTWTVVVADAAKGELTLVLGMWAPGNGCLSFTVTEDSEEGGEEGDANGYTSRYRTVDVRGWFHPNGVGGRLFWAFLTVPHLFAYWGMSRRIARVAEQEEGL